MGRSKKILSAKVIFNQRPEERLVIDGREAQGTAFLEAGTTVAKAVRRA